MSFPCVFFFSSRRRHTRYIGDWSSDVCSSDLGCQLGFETVDMIMRLREALFQIRTGPVNAARSEERRVGKECRTGWGGRFRKQSPRGRLFDEQNLSIKGIGALRMSFPVAFLRG